MAQRRNRSLRGYKTITIYSDNKEVIGKANDDEEPLNVSAHLKPEYDIGQVIQRKYISSLLFVAFGFPLGF